jgi:SAM-dependent methyltransferase
MNTLLSRLFSNPKVKHDGLALDLGFGDGKNAILLSQKGFRVKAVEKDSDKIERFKREAGQLKIELILDDVSNIPLDEDTYSLILAHNVLSFLSNKKGVLKIIEKCIDSLSQDGYFIFTIFGKKDEWSKKHKDMTFFDSEEILKELEKKPVTIYFKSSEEGYGPTMKGDVKYWQIHKFIVQKNK